MLNVHMFGFQYWKSVLFAPPGEVKFPFIKWKSKQKASNIVILCSKTRNEHTKVYIVAFVWHSKSI